MMWYYLYPSVKEVQDLPLYVISIGLHELQPRIDRPNGYPHDQFFYNSCGSGWLELDGKQYELPEGSAFFIPANMPHCYYPEDDIWDIRWVELAGSALPELLRKYNLDKGGVYSLADESGLDRILNRMRMDIITHPEHGNMLASGRSYSFFMEFVYQTRFVSQEEKSTYPHEEQIMALKEYISIHFMHPISMDDLCKVVPVTHQHMCRIFKEMTGQRPIEYVNQVRVDMSKQLLLYSEDPIHIVGKKCGFQNANYYCKVFKKQEKMTPLEYRNSVL